MDEKAHETLINKDMVLSKEMDKFMDDVMSAVQTHFISGQDTLTKEKAIDYLRKCGWMEKHDKEITESEYKRGYGDGIAEIRVCDYCAKEYGTFGCCTTVNNEWKYSCDEGIKQYAEQQYKRGYEDGVATQGFTDGFTQEDMEKEYQRGYEDGRKSNEVTLTTDGTITVPSQSVLGVAAMAIADDKMGYKHGYDDGYQRGLDDMRDALLAISKWGNYYKKQIFHGNYDAIPILRDHEAKYIVDEARRYQEEQAEAIKVGDEVRKIDLDYDCRVVVTSLLAEDKADTMNFQGCHYQILLHEWEKTGRTFPEIAEVLDKLKGGEE